MIDTIINTFDKIAGPVFAALLSVYIIWRYRQRKKAAYAAVVFRDKVLAEIQKGRQLQNKLLTTVNLVLWSRTKVQAVKRNVVNR